MPQVGHYRAMKRMREREVIEAARKLAKVHHENGTINEAGRALAELRGAMAVLEAAEHQAVHDRPATPTVEAITGDGCWVRLKADGADIPMHPDQAADLYVDLGRLVDERSVEAARLRRSRP